MSKQQNQIGDGLPSEEKIKCSSCGNLFAELECGNTCYDCAYERSHTDYGVFEN